MSRRVNIELWAQDNFGTLALARTVFGLVKVIIAIVIMNKILGGV